MGLITADLFFGALICCSVVLLFSSEAYGFLINVILLVANVQLGLAAVWYYDMFQGSELSRLWFYEMAVSKDDYCAVLVHLLFAFNVGLILPQMRPKKNRLELKGGSGYKEGLQKFYFAVGLITWLVWLFAYQGQGSFYVLLGKRLILVYSLFQLSRNPPDSLRGLLTERQFLLFMIISLSEIMSGMYGDLVINLVLLIAVLIQVGLLSTKQRIAGFLIFLPILLLVQVSKGEIRERSWQGSENIISSTVEVLKSNARILDERIGQEAVLFNVISRLNQGRIMSHVIAWHEVEEEDSELRNRFWIAMQSALVPRFLWQDKPKAGGAENIRLYTNVYKEGGTSMNIGYFSDFVIAFGDFALIGIFWFTFFSGRAFFRFCQFRDLTQLFLMVTFFFALVQVETDFFMVLNQMVKVLIAMGILSFLSRKNWIR